MKRKLPLMVIVSSILLTGCWDQRELSDISVVIGMAIDKSEQGKYSVTVEGINAQELNGKTASGFAPSVVFTLEGETVTELTQKMNVGLSKHLIYSHMRTLIISEEIAREGLAGFLDFLERDREVRDDFNILVARGVSAADILRVTYPLQKSSSLKLHTQLNSMVENWGGDPDVRLNDVVQAMRSPGRQPVMAALTIRGDPAKGGNVENIKKVTPDAIVVMDSLAIFNKEILEGFLPLEDSRNYLWIDDKLSRTALSVPCGKNKFFGVHFYNSKTRTKAKMVKGIPVINVKIRAEAYLDGIHCQQDLTQIKTYQRLERLTEKEIKSNIGGTVKKLQQEYQLDIFGFGETLYRQDYQNFKKVKAHWNETFKDSIVKIDVKVNLRRSGIRTKSLLSEND